MVAEKLKVLKVIFDPSAMIKGLKTSCYGQLKGLIALKYSRLRASLNPEKSRNKIFESPWIGILKKSRDPAGACLKRLEMFCTVATQF